MDSLIHESLASLNDWCALSLSHLVFLVSLIANTDQGDLCGIAGMGERGQENKRKKILGRGERFLE